MATPPLGKLSPLHTIALRGFDDRGAAAALHSVTEDSFAVEGVFRDPADFCVLMLYDADNYYEHPRFRYLPDFDFAGVVLTFDLRYEGLQPIDSQKYPTIDWPFLDVVKADGSTALVRLRDNATALEGEDRAAVAAVDVVATAIPAGCRCAIWYNNLAFESYPLPAATAASIAQDLVDQINGANYGDGIPLVAQRDGDRVLVTYGHPEAGARGYPGLDGHHARLVCTSNDPALTLETPDGGWFRGGASPGAWRVRLDFSALGLEQIRQAWLTFAPALAEGAAYEATEWRANFTNWTVTGERKALLLAGPGSVRVEETDPWCSYAGTWTVESGFYSRGFCKVGSLGAQVTVRYACPSPHDLYIGTALASDRGTALVTLDGVQSVALNTRLAGVQPQVVTRRRLHANVAAGEHTVVLTVDEGPLYFDFLEAAVLAETTEPEPLRDWVSPACDYGTDHTYKLAPARLLNNLEWMGYGGPLNVYVSVFWWNQRKNTTREAPVLTVTFSGSWVGLAPSIAGDQIFIRIGDFSFGKTVFSYDTDADIARHFAAFINGISVGVYAEADGATLRVFTRAVGPAYQYAHAVTVELQPGSTGTATVSGALTGGNAGRWDVDPEASPVLNRGARSWLEDLARECAARSRELTLAYSMELLNPPEAWAARYPDGEAVTTATGFSTNFTTHCTFGEPGMLAYQQKVYLETAALLHAAGLRPVLQFGEFLWWFFPNAAGMGFYDSATRAAADAALGRPLHVFTGPNDDTAAHPGDVEFLAARLDAHCRALREHVQAEYPDALFEILLALDVNFPEEYRALSPISGTEYALGGRLNHAVNVPAVWRSPTTAPFDRVKMEGLDNGAGSRHLDRARRVLRFPFTEGSWSREQCRYLVPIFNGGCPWVAEYFAARDAGVPVINYWAWDHTCIFGWPLEEPMRAESVFLV